MAYNTNLVSRVREFLAEIPNIEVEEKEMFAVLNFMVNGKTCVCVSGDNLMLRFDPKLQEELSERNGYETMLMKGKAYKGYCYIHPEGFKGRKDFEYFINLCIDYNKVSNKSKKKLTPNNKTAPTGQHTRS
ncbi:MAG: TfoX/Sxy family protein [Bacteroidia bacterium]